MYKIDEYIIDTERKLGKGSYGTVVLGYGPDEEVVAVKQMALNFWNNKRLGHILSEIESMKVTNS